ncbi:MAG: hypothetical protein M1834_004919 [Cirrosporium novae-zelandiae]|nr:MAG: hypothetical protein M1834_004919 [Cirrosporium novae-zelandiae]
MLDLCPRSDKEQFQNEQQQASLLALGAVPMTSTSPDLLPNPRDPLPLDDQPTIGQPGNSPNVLPALTVNTSTINYTLPFSNQHGQIPYGAADNTQQGIAIDDSTSPVGRGDSFLDMALLILGDLDALGRGEASAPSFFPDSSGGEGWLW